MHNTLKILNKKEILYMLNFDDEIVDNFLQACKYQLLNVEYNRENSSIIVSRITDRDEDISHITSCEISLLPSWVKSFLKIYTDYVDNFDTMPYDFFELYKWTKRMFSYSENVMNIDIEGFDFIE